MSITLNFRRAAAAASLLALVGCASTTHRAPVEDRDQGRGAAGATAPKPPPGAENAGKPGYYTVKQGDTLLRISLDTGQNWRDIAAWNNLENPDRIEVGQVLRVVPPGSEATAVASIPAAKPIAGPKIESRPLDSAKPAPSKPASGAAAGSASAASSAASSGATAGSTPASTASGAASGGAAGATADNAEPSWMWPATGPTLATFEQGKRNGLAIGGKMGDPVVAAGDGRVVYAGSGLRGYGNLVIIKHAGDYLTAYAHNQTLLVKEDQMVRKGQKIAEMGSSDADRVELHFEIRKQGKPIDPAKQLPAR